MATGKMRWMGVAAAALLTSTTAQAGDVTGRVVAPNGRPMAGARVAIDDLMRGAVTGTDGGFRIPGVPAGTYEIGGASFGMSTAHQQITVPETGAVEASFALQPNMALAKAAAAYVAPPLEHLSEKAAYLDRVAATKPGDRPNVVVILFDDLGYGDLSGYGNRLIKTPNIDALSKRGATLSQFYSSSPVCTPSRAALLTGRYPTRSYAANHVFFPTGHPIAGLRRAMGYANALPTDEILLPEILSKAGYATGAFGKWHLGDTQGHRPTERGFSTYFGVPYSNDMAPLAMYRGTTVDTPPDKLVQGTLTERFTDEAVSFMRDNAKRPFFLYLPYTAPHLPHHPNPKHSGVSDGGPYGDVIEDLDANVGRVMRTLDELGLSKNTIVIVTSDNGGDFGGSAGELRGRKGETFEGGMRVPAFVIWPGKVRPGSKSDQMAMNIDLLPTVLTAAGLPLPSDRLIDGRDIAPMLAGKASTPHDHLFYVTMWTGEYEAVRGKDYKYRDRVQKPATNPFYPAASPLGSFAEPALYDLNRDNESHDVTLKHPQIAADLKATLQTFRESLASNPRGWLPEGR
ncbi:sulfatase-like hydrolase/transferase [Phenylobacterium sp. Root700]|uniref:sulfatase-like hydrolase/transferase n=1 Tax=Phenylobacterium sp. Root700 TaxID=1736591 RepID=UPI000A90566E|nr:sulfatase-like hydrolase/transferase [Phenylobacterium sp. Root700]